MRQAKWIIAFIAVFSFTVVSAQEKKSAAPQQNEGKKNAVKTPEGSNQPQTSASDTASAAPAGEADAASAKKSGNSTQTSGLMEHTSSPSGSPSILSDERGTARDGTNNMQRATMNMAGSPVENLALSKKPVDVNNEAERGRKRVSRSGGNTESNQINENSRRENNDQSDQNLSSKNKGTKIIQQDTRKRNRKKSKKG
jgi:hypothetical protein